MKKKSRRPTIKKRDIWFGVFVVAWTVLSLSLSQVLISRIMYLFLGKAVAEPLWTLVFYIINYLFALALIILVPPLLWKFISRRRLQTKKEASGSASDAVNDKNGANTENSEIATSLQTTPSDLGVDKWPTFVDLGLAPIGYVAYIVVAAIATHLMQIFPWFNSAEEQNVGFSYFLTTQDRILAMIAIVLVAPIAEELIMRGWLYGKLRSRFGLVISVLITSLTFAVLHGQWNVGVSVFVLSLALCSLREITGAIWSGMLLHILSNGVAFYLVYVANVGFL